MTERQYEESVDGAASMASEILAERISEAFEKRMAHLAEQLAEARKKEAGLTTELREAREHIERLEPAAHLDSYDEAELEDWEEDDLGEHDVELCPGFAATSREH